MEQHANTATHPTDHPENSLRKWAAPLTIGFFALSVFTGILLFLKVHLGLLGKVHEWASILLVLSSALHIAVNWRSTQRYFSQRHTKAILAVVIVLMCVSLLPVADNEHGKGRGHGRQTFSATQFPEQQQGNSQNGYDHR